MPPSDTPPPVGDIVTFYSYKGGTGRSMALANIGVILARGVAPGDKPVLMIDWDLEAPGLYKYFPETPSETGGLIDLLTDVAGQYARLAPDGNLPEAAAWTEPALQAFAEITRLFPTENYRLPVGQAGLFLVPSGRLTAGPDDKYASKIRDFRWEEFYVKYGSFFTLWRTKLMEQYQSVLIDSRTGLTDSSGICTRVMPGSLVAVFVPNEQNLHGLSGVIRASLEYRRQSRDQRQIVVYPLASRIDGQSGDLREIWWHGGLFAGREIKGYQQRFEELLKELYSLEECNLTEYFDDTQIPHDSAYAYGERIASLTSTTDSLSIGKKCANLAARLRSRALPWESMDATKAKIAAAHAEAESAKRQAEVLKTRFSSQRKQTWWSTATGVAIVASLFVFRNKSGADSRLLSEAAVNATVTTRGAASLAVPGLRESVVRADGKRHYSAAFGYTVSTSNGRRTAARIEILRDDSVTRTILAEPHPSGWARVDSVDLGTLPVGQYRLRLTDIAEDGSSPERTFEGNRFLRIYDAK